MMQSEFQERVQMQVSPAEYAAIEAVYNESDLNKDDFCKLWVKMNQTRVNKAKAEARARAEKEALRDKDWEIISKYGGVWNCQQPASKFLKKRERAFCESIGIKVRDMENEYLSTTLSTVIYELRKFCKAA